MLYLAKKHCYVTLRGEHNEWFDHSSATSHPAITRDSPHQQDEIARLIEGQLVPATILPSYAGSMPDLPDDFEEELMRRRHDVPPTPPMDKQLQELLEDESK